MRALPLLLVLAACAGPPPEAYVGGSAQSGAPVGLGRDTAGEACTQQAGAGGAAVFCGAWQQPSGRVTRGGAADAAALAGLAATSPWRSALDSRMTCGEPAATTILGDVPAVALSCTRRVGGWPQAALVASVAGTAYFADGIVPALPALERSIGVLSGRLSAGAAPSAAPGAADGLFAARLAAQSFGANDIGQYDELMLAGTRANLAESYVPAEQAFRAALALQQKTLGRNDPNTAVPLMHVALQLSDQGRSADADAAFARAAQLAPGAADPAVGARLAHYQALAAINAGRGADALPLLRTAEARYAALLPAELLATTAAAPRVLQASRRTAEASGSGVAGSLGSGMVLDPGQQTALIGVVETRRYQAIALRDLGRGAEADAMIRSADTLAVARGLRQRNLTARLYRTSALIADQQDDAGLRRMGLASADFGQSQPGSRPLAATELLRAGELSSQGGDALPLCRRAVALLRALKTGTTAALMAPCLQVYADAAAKDPAGRQGLLGAMFEASQMIQGGITSQQIALASARLTASAKDPRVGAAIRRQQDSGNALAELERQRDAAAAPGLRDPGGARAKSPDDLARSTTEARAALADADAALQAAAPQYGQLVQQVATAADVLAALRPGEAFAAITLTNVGGWVFVLRDGQVDAAPAGLDLAAATATVKRVRATLEPTSAGLPPFDAADAAKLYADTLGRLRGRLDGARALVVAPAGPLLSLPFGMLLTGPAEPGALAGAPWLVRQMAVSHVPAAANFVSLRRAAGVGARGAALVRLRRLPAGHAAAGRAQLPAAAPAKTAPGCSPGCPPLPVRPAGAGRRSRAARRRPVATRWRARPSPPPGAEDRSAPVPRAALRDPRAAADRPAVPERAGDRRLRAAGGRGRVRRAADQRRGDGHGARCGRGDPVGLQLRRAGRQQWRARACRAWRGRSSMPARAR